MRIYLNMACLGLFFISSCAFHEQVDNKLPVNNKISDQNIEDCSKELFSNLQRNESNSLTLSCKTKTNQEVLLNDLLKSNGNINSIISGAIKSNQIEVLHNLIPKGVGLIKTLELAIVIKGYAAKNKIKNTTAKKIIKEIITGKYSNDNDELGFLDYSKITAFAACFNDNETIDLILEKNPDTNINVSILAANISGHDGLVIKLLKRNKDKDFSVYWAAKFNEIDVMWYLIKKGASKNEAIKALKELDGDANKVLIEQIQNFRS